MASLTISDLKSELINHGVELPLSSAKKEEYVQLYEKNISTGGEKAKIDFSSDDEEVSIPMGGKVSKKKVSRKSEVTNGTNGNAENNSEANEQEMLTEENSLVVGDVDVAALTDEQLSEMLKEFNVPVGPIVDSTRAVYRKKLAITMRELTNEKLDIVVEANGTTQTNGISNDNNEGELQNGEFSADDEELVDEVPQKEILEDDQPSLLVRPSVTPTKESKKRVSARSASKTSSIAKAKAALSEVRQRFTGSNREGTVTDGRYTPTPRRSIHSYKVTETSKETVTKMKDGTISRDFDYKKTTSDSKDEIGTVRKFLRFLPSLFLLLIIIAVGYYIYVSRK